jgi:hypothetical protein
VPIWKGPSTSHWLLRAKDAFEPHCVAVGGVVNDVVNKASSGTCMKVVLSWRNIATVARSDARVVSLHGWASRAVHRLGVQHHGLKLGIYIFSREPAAYHVVHIPMMQFVRW